MTPPADLLRRMEAIIAALEPLTRAVFLAHRVDGMPYDRIALELKISIAEVEKRLASAILTIAERLDQWEAKPPG